MAAPVHRQGYALDDLENGRAGSTKESRREKRAQHMPSGERHGFNPIMMLRVMWRSSCPWSSYANLIFPIVPVGLALHWARPDLELAIFVTNYLAMIPTANMLGFCSGELAEKIPNTFMGRHIPARVIAGVLETTLAASVELILCLLLLFHGGTNSFQVIQAALLGSMLANLLLSTGACFVIGGIRHHDHHNAWDETVTETAGGLLLLAIAALMMPCAFYESVQGAYQIEDLESRVLNISRITSILLIIAYAIYLFYQLKTHHSIFDKLLENAERRDKDRHEDHARPKLTLAESLLAVAVMLTLVTLHALFMVQQIHYIVEVRGVSDAFVGLILVPLVEKVAEHLVALDEAWDDAMDFALSHTLGATIQTALFVSPIVVFVAWGANLNFDLNFELYMVVLLVLSVLVVGRFIQDSKSTYLEGALCIIFYMVIAVGTYYYPNPEEGITGEEGVVSNGGEAGVEGVTGGGEHKRWMSMGMS